MDKCKYNCKFCNYNKQEYNLLLDAKQLEIKKLFSNYNNKILPIVPCENNINYRNKVTITFDYQKKRVIAGIYDENSHNVIEIKDCFLQNVLANNIIKSLVKLINDFKITAYNERSRYGILRHAQIRVSNFNNDILLTLVATEKNFKSSKNFIKALVKENPNIKSVVINYNDKITTQVLGEYDTVVYGSGLILDKICGFKFLIVSKSFYQVNPKQTELLYTYGIDVLDIKITDVVLDLYCGLGTIGILASKYANIVTGVELNKQAVDIAKKNASLNNIDNIRFVNADSTKFLNDYKGNIDVLIMDPPRSGASKEFMKAILKLKPSKILYISCNPITQLSDFNYIKSAYNIKSIKAFDMFPYTNHIESVCVLERK